MGWVCFYPASSGSLISGNAKTFWFRGNSSRDCSAKSMWNSPGQVLLCVRWGEPDDFHSLEAFWLMTMAVSVHAGLVFFFGKNSVLTWGVCPPHSFVDPSGKEWLRNGFSPPDWVQAHHWWLKQGCGQPPSAVTSVGALWFLELPWELWVIKYPLLQLHCLQKGSFIEHNRLLFGRDSIGSLCLTWRPLIFWLGD